MPISVNQREGYLARKGNRCLYCQSLNITTGYVDYPIMEEGIILERGICLVCGKEWIDRYTLTDVEEIEEVDLDDCR